MKKLNLHNGDLQPDFPHERLFLDSAGKHIAAMRSAHVRLYVNDVYCGLHLAVEQPDKTMMQSRFGDDEDGNLDAEVPPPPAVLLRESFRENGKVHNRTLAHLSHWPPDKIEALRRLQLDTVKL